MRQSPFSFVVPASLFVFAAACGGKVTFELGSGGDGGTGQATTGNVNTVNGTTGVGKTTSVGPTTNVGPTTTGVSTVGGTTAFASVTVTSSTGVFTGPPVNCNGGPCNDGDVCCFNPNGPGDHCGQSGQCDPGYIELSCDTPANCSSGVCCATFNQNTQKYEGIACQASCDGPADITMCSNNPPSQCPMGEQCHASMQLGQGYHVCF